MLVRRDSDTPYQDVRVSPRASSVTMPTALSASHTSTISSSPPATTMATATVTNGVNTSRVRPTEISSENPAMNGEPPKEPSRISLSLSKLLPLIGKDGIGSSTNNSAASGNARNIDQTIGEGAHQPHGEEAVENDHLDVAEDTPTGTDIHNGVATRDEEAIWQEDSGVKACPLCDAKFTFFNRRHHCRKCGKIFCNKCCGKFCTFIPGSSVVEPEEEGGRSIVRNGYQYYKFRTCEKCYGEIKMLKEALGIADDSEEDSREEDTEEEEDDESAEGGGDDNESFERHLSIMGEDRSGNASGPEWRRSRRRAGARTRSRTGRETSIEGPIRSQGEEGDDADAESLTCLIKHSQPREITMEVSESRVREADGTTGGAGAGEGPRRGNGNTSIDHNNNSNNNNNSELNECPVCGIDIGGVSETERETHINRCLTDQEFGSPTHPGDVAKRDKNRMLVYSIPADADMAHMVLNDDNECVICLEEFCPGDKLGRLECLCCFHYKCIKDWIRKKGYCECPIHALHAQ